MQWDLNKRAHNFEKFPLQVPFTLPGDAGGTEKEGAKHVLHVLILEIDRYNASLEAYYNNFIANNYTSIIYYILIKKLTNR